MPADASGSEGDFWRDSMKVGTQNETNRNEWVRKTLARIPEGTRILDAGSGERQFKKFCSHLEYVAQDFGQYNGSGDKRGLQTGKWDQSGIDIISDINEIPAPDGSFGAILCTEVFEHLPNPLAAISEFKRLLKEGGYLILTAPFCSLTHFSPYHFFSGFNRYFYETHLTQNGFQILDIQTNGNFFEYLGQETRRIGDVAARYTDTLPNFIERLALRFVLRLLQRLSERDKGSEELLCFGYHVLARKD